MTQSCRNCGNAFEILDADQEVLRKLSPVIGGKTHLIPPPTLCFECRHQRRWAVRNQYKLYKRQCDLTKEEMISVYSPDKPYTVYREDVWWSDKWDALTHGRAFDFSRPFFQQFNELLTAVPRSGMRQDGTNENSDYTTFGTGNRNCYLSSTCINCEDVSYSSWIAMSRDCMDCLRCIKCELCHECVDCETCYRCASCHDCATCSDAFLLHDCRDCRYCICCKNLRGKEYHIYNAPVSREEFEAFRKRLAQGALREERRKFDAWKLQLPYRASHIVASENCTGDYIEHARNCVNCFDVTLGAEDMRHCQFAGMKAKDTMDCTMVGSNSELLYEMQGVSGTHRCAFGSFCRGGHNVYYSESTSHCSDCFGCVGLREKKYCVLNRQYSKDEYEELVPRIIEYMTRLGEYGEFFPITIAPFAYNETIAHEYYPLTEEEARAKGWKWKERNQREYVPATATVPESIDAVPEALARETLACEQCSKNYRIIAKDLTFYRTIGIPLPHLCLDCRHLARINLRNPRKLWERPCANCGTILHTSYAPERPEIIFCEKCYLEAVY